MAEDFGGLVENLGGLAGEFGGLSTLIGCKSKGAKSNNGDDNLCNVSAFRPGDAHSTPRQRSFCVQWRRFDYITGDSHKLGQHILDAGGELSLLVESLAQPSH
jgi:hypothetical protein